MEIIISILLAVFSYKTGMKSHKELMDYLSSNENEKECKDFIGEKLKDITEQRMEKLAEIRQELIHKGDLILAEEINNIITGKYKIPQESFIILNACMESDKLYKTAINKPLLPSE